MHRGDIIMASHVMAEDDAMQGSRFMTSIASRTRPITSRGYGSKASRGQAGGAIGSGTTDREL